MRNIGLVHTQEKIVPYLRNSWYLAAWQDEIPADKPLARQIMDEPIVFFRNEANEVSALLDRCPHRFAPLSRGTVSHGLITCPYHGLAFHGTGQCGLNPHGPVLKTMAAKSFPILEAYRGVWIWMGDSTLADPALLPDLSFVDRTPETAFSKGYVCGNGNYQLFVDNILDLSHADYLHPTTLGGGSFTRTRAVVKDTPRGLDVKWHSDNEVPFPLLAAALKEKNQRVDSWTEVEWFPPSVMTLRSGFVPTGTSKEGAGSFLNLHIMTPESVKKTHYFYASTRDFAVEDAALNTFYSQSRAEIFATEDKPMIEAQQGRLGDADFWSLDPILLRSDEGAIRVRRKLQKMIDDEQQTEESLKIAANR